ncbi:MAG: ferrous iron transport protein B [Thermodesulfovibrionales bacterium]|nr:ferrous iron transport protein B [Thermodesulfovibrionales bacterium]
MKESQRGRQKGGVYGRIALVGNPNVGKSVIFGLLTGRYATVSNYPGTTIEITSAPCYLNGKKYLIIDTPGINNLIPMSEDEKVTRDILLRDRPDAVIQIIDAKNLKRGLFITIQLAEMGIPLVVDLNMIDEARDRGILIDEKKLSDELGAPVVSTIASQKKGLSELKSATASPQVPSIMVNYGTIIEDALKELEMLLPDSSISKRSIGLMILSGDETLKGWLRASLSEKTLERIEEIRDRCAEKLKTDPGLIINAKRLALAESIGLGAIKRISAGSGGLAQLLGNLSMHPLWGLPVLGFVLFLLYEFVGIFGAGTLVDLLEEGLFGEYINPMFTKIVEFIIPLSLLREALVGEYGMITVAITYAIGIILPITTTFFIAFSILEDCGYLPRLAIMSNRLFKTMGLSGKAVLPMVLGLGCGTMAVMTTRILETNRERLLAAFLLALAVPCSAQLGVILGMLGSFSWKATLIWFFTVLSVLLLMGSIASRIVRGESSEFFMEIPPMRMPVLENVLIKTFNRVVWYLREAVPLFILGTFILFILHKIAILDWIKHIASPIVVNLLGLPEKTTEAFLLGFLRRDYGAAGLFDMSKEGILNPLQSLVSLITITLFVPCLAHFLMMVKEFGLRVAFMIVLVVFPSAILFGGLVNLVLRSLNISF